MINSFRLLQFSCILRYISNRIQYSKILFFLVHLRDNELGIALPLTVFLAFPMKPVQSHRPYEPNEPQPNILHCLELLDALEAEGEVKIEDAAEIPAEDIVAEVEDEADGCRLIISTVGFNFIVIHSIKSSVKDSFNENALPFGADAGEVTLMSLPSIVLDFLKTIPSTFFPGTFESLEPLLFLALKLASVKGGLPVARGTSS